MFAVATVEVTDCKDVAEWFKEACARTGIKLGAVAMYMGIPASLLSQQIHGMGNVSLNKLAAMACYRTPEGKEDPDAIRYLRTLFSVAGDRLGFSELEQPVVDELLTVTVYLIGKYNQAKAKLAVTPKRGVA